MADCMDYMYGLRLDQIPLSEKAQALKRKSPNKSGKEHPGSYSVWMKKKRRTGENNLVVI
jgi:hypothetical protein